MEPKSFLDKMFHAREKVSMLLGNTINYVSEFILSSIDNKTCYVKEMIKQPDRADFINAMERKNDAHERINHW